MKWLIFAKKEGEKKDATDFENLLRRVRSKGSNPYERTDDARCFLCTWCSARDIKDATSRAEAFKTDFRELHGVFSELVDVDGWGDIRNLCGIVDFESVVAVRHPQAFFAQTIVKTAQK